MDRSSSECLSAAYWGKGGGREGGKGKFFGTGGKGKILGNVIAKEAFS